MSAVTLNSDRMYSPSGQSVLFGEMPAHEVEAHNLVNHIIATVQANEPNNDVQKSNHINSTTNGRANGDTPAIINIDIDGKS